METRDMSSGFSLVRESAPSLFVAAFCSVAVLVTVLLMGLSRGANRQYAQAPAPAAAVRVGAGAADLAALGAGAENGMATSDIAMVGPAVVGQLVSQYQQLKNSGAYSPAAAAQAAQQLGQQISLPIAYKHYAISDITTSADTSYSAMLAYRERLRQAIAPMTEISDLEIAVFAKYAASKDPTYLQELNSIIATYQNAIAAAAALTVPQDAARYHVGILNAMGEFGATLQDLVDNVDDPITTVTLLRSYQDAENNMVTSFNDLAQYYAHHSRS